MKNAHLLKIDDEILIEVFFADLSVCLFAPNKVLMNLWKVGKMDQTSNLDFIRDVQVVWVLSSIKVTNHLEPKALVTQEGPQTSEYIKLLNISN